MNETSQIIEPALAYFRNAPSDVKSKRRSGSVVPPRQNHDGPELIDAGLTNAIAINTATQKMVNTILTASGMVFCHLTLELSRPRRQALEARTETMYGVPQAGLPAHAVAGRLERWVRAHCPSGPNATRSSASTLADVSTISWLTMGSAPWMMEFLRVMSSRRRSRSD